jgi:hypothetical protein
VLGDGTLHAPVEQRAEEANLGGTARLDGLGPHCDHGRQVAGTGAPLAAAALDGGIDLLGRGTPSAQDLVDVRRQRGSVNNAGDVDERAREGRDRHAVDAPPISGVDGAPVDARDAGPGALRQRDQDVGKHRRAPESVQRHGGEVRGEGVGPGREAGGEGIAPPSGRCPADCVDATSQTNERTCARPVLDLVG